MRLQLILFLLIAFNWIFAQSPVEFEIEAEKTTYYVSEDIYVKFRYVNPTSIVAKLPSIYYYQYYCLEDEKGDIHKTQLRFHIIYEFPYYNVLPGDSIFAYHKILPLFDPTFRTENNSPYGIPAGQYTLYFKYDDEEFHLESNKLSIAIIPVSKEEYEPFLLYNEAIKLFYNSKKSEEKHKLFLRIVDEYPQSVYAPSALNMARVTSGLSAELFCKRLIKEYPQRFVTSKAIERLVLNHQSRKDKAGIENLLREFTTQYAGTFMANEARRRLNEIESLTMEEWLNLNIAREKKLKEYEESLKEE